MNPAELVRFVRHEARLLDEARWDEWLTLFAADGHYWVPLAAGQTDPLGHNSLAYEDELLLRLRVERLKQDPFSQHPRSRCQHVLQEPEVEAMQGDLHVMRTPFLYAEVRGDEQQVHAGVVFHHLRETTEGLRIVLKRGEFVGFGDGVAVLAVIPMTVAATFRRSVAAWADRPFLCILPETAAAYGIAAGEISYAQAGVSVDALEAEYRAAGFGAGHRVGLMLDNRPAFFFHWLALNACGASVVPLNPDLRPAELDYLLAHSGLVHAVAAEPHRAVMQAAAARAPHAVSVSCLRSSNPLPEAEDFSRLLSRGEGSASAAECALLYTSGTTGKPKGCVLSNDYFIRAGAWYIAAGDLCAIDEGTDRLITPLPMVHMNAMAFSTMAMIMSGGCVVPLDRFHPRSWWDSVRESGATIIHYLGVMPSMLLGATPSPADREHTVRFGFGAGVDRRHQAVFEERFGFPLLEAWAMTETGSGGCIIANHAPRRVGAACFGRADPAIEMQIVDEAGDDVPDGTPGELLVRAAGPDPHAGFFSEYLHDPDATLEAWAGGWFHTGDVIQREANGDLLFIDRRKNVIRRSGENISAVEVESVLRRHPAVAEIAVAPTPDAIRGEEVLACVVPSGAATPDVAAAIVTAALEELSYFKVPGWVAFVDALPLTATNKVQRGELKARAATLPGTPGCIDTRALKTRARA